MIKTAFDVNGNKFALPTVQIAGEGEPPPPRPAPHTAHSN
jgi:hypothetical protein